MSHSIRERTLAFAGIFQATDLVNQIACKGMVDQATFESSINSLFQISPDTTEEVFGGVVGVRHGLRCLIKQLENNQQTRDVNIARYVISLLHLERKLNKQPKMLQKIADGIENARSQSRHFSTTHPNVIANLAGLYQETISNLMPRIMVSGEHGHLTIAENAEKVRALLLAGIRATILWRQCGGTRWQLLLKRKEMLDSARQLLSQVTNT